MSTRMMALVVGLGLVLGGGRALALAAPALAAPTVDAGITHLSAGDARGALVPVCEEEWEDGEGEDEEPPPDAALDEGDHRHGEDGPEDDDEGDGGADCDC